MDEIVQVGQFLWDNIVDVFGFDVFILSCVCIFLGFMVVMLGKLVVKTQTKSTEVMIKSAQNHKDSNDNNKENIATLKLISLSLAKIEGFISSMSHKGGGQNGN